jgi:hypothetical protein
VFVDRRAVALVMLVEGNAVVWELQQASEPALTVLDRLAPNILPVHLKRVECAEDGAAVATMTADQVEHRHPAVVTYDRLGIDHARFDRKRQYRRGCQREAIGQIVAIARQEPRGAAIRTENRT